MCSWLQLVGNERSKEHPLVFVVHAFEILFFGHESALGMATDEEDQISEIRFVLLVQDGTDLSIPVTCHTTHGVFVTVFGHE